MADAPETTAGEVVSTLHTTEEKSRERAFSWKAVAIGVIGVIIINGFAGFNDDHLKGTLFVGNHLPISAYFLLFCLVLIWNPVASLLGRLFGGKSGRCMLSTKELAVVLGVMLVGSWTPTSGLYRYLHRQLVVPWYKLPNKQLWQKYDDHVLGGLPEKLFPSPGPSNAEVPEHRALYERVYGGFHDGLAKGQDTIWPWEMPDVLGAWMPPMAYWGPMLLCFSVATIALALLVHRQWADHEQLSYPLAQISTGMIRRDTGRRLPDVFYSKLFLWGAFFVLAIQLFRLSNAWYPNAVPALKLDWFMPWHNVFKSVPQAGAWFVNRGRFFFTIIGVSYFISSEMAFSMGFSNIGLAILMVLFYLFTGNPVSNASLEDARGGAYVGYALILLFTGRTYYLSVFRKALTLGDKNEKDAEATLAARLFLVSFGGFWVMMTLMGLDWFVSLLFCGMTMLLFLVFSRIVCETGIPFLQAGWFPGILLARTIGISAVGAAPLTFVYWMGTILAQDPRECLMPYISTSLKIADDTKLKLRTFMHVAIWACVVALLIGFFAKCMNCYNYGAAEDRWAFKYVPTIPFDRAADDISFMDETGQLEASAAASGLGKLRLMSFEGDVWGFFLFGMLCVALFSALRFRFSWWPLHPVMFLVWKTYPLNCVFYAFLIGWAVKLLVVRFGGGKVYNDIKPLFIGLIVGDLSAATIGVVIGIVYYFVTGNVPERFAVFPA